MKVKKVYLIYGAAALVVVLLAACFLLRGDSESDVRENAEAMLREGQEAFNKNDVMTAFNKLQKARTGFDKAGDHRGFFEASVYLSMIYDLIGQKEQGYKILKETEFIDVPNYKAYSSQYYLRMMAYMCTMVDKNYKQAEEYIKKCIIFDKEKYPKDTTFIYMDKANLAEMYILQGNYGKAKAITEKLIRSKPTDNKIYLSQLYYCMGLIACNEMKIDSAYSYLEKGMAYSRRYSAFNNQINILNTLARLDSTNNDMKSYILHKQEYDRLRSKISGNEIYYKIALMQEKHKMDMMKQENEKTRVINLLSLILLSLIPLIMGGIFIAVYKNVKTRQKVDQLEKQRLDGEIQMEKLEKELLKLKVEKKDEIIDKAQKENIAMSLQLAGTEKRNGNLKRLERQLNDMDRNFIKKVETRFPHLTRNDLRLICFIKQGIDSHEIASLLNITVESLHKSRYRLRKKLDLDGSQSLETFINSIS